MRMRWRKFLPPSLLGWACRVEEVISSLLRPTTLRMCSQPSCFLLSEDGAQERAMPLQELQVSCHHCHIYAVYTVKPFGVYVAGETCRTRFLPGTGGPRRSVHVGTAPGGCSASLKLLSTHQGTNISRVYGSIPSPHLPLGLHRGREQPAGSGAAVLGTRNRRAHRVQALPQPHHH